MLRMLVTVACFLSLCGSLRAATSLLDDFEAADSPAPWSFSNGGEFPGAAGSLAGGLGESGKGMTVNYDFTGGGAYVAVYRNFTPALNPSSILGWSARVPADIQIGLRVVDTTGQWLQYVVPRPIAPLDPSAWYHQFYKPGWASGYWGGANDGVIHGGIVTVGFTISKSAIKSGAVAFDNLLTLTSLDASISPWTSTTGAFKTRFAPPPAGVTDVLSGLGVNMHGMDDPTGLDAAKSAGLNLVRIDFFWNWVETQKGVYNFAPWDNLAKQLADRQMKGLFILCYGNSLYGDSPPLTAEAKDAYTAYAKATVEHYAVLAQQYPGVDVRFEIWNEPDGFSFENNPTGYAAMAAQAIPAMHQGSPAAQVTTGGLSWYNYSYLIAELQAGAGANANAIGIHSYRNNNGPESVGGDVLVARAWVKSLVAHNPPMWDTEWGYSAQQFYTGDLAKARMMQAVFAVRRMLCSKLAAFPYSIWYDLRDDGADPNNIQHNFGLLDGAGVAKPALTALRTFKAQATGRRLTGILDIAQPILNGVRLQGAANTLLMLWTAQGTNVPVSLVQAPVQALDLLGQALPVATTYTLTEEGGPIYFLFPSGASDFNADGKEDILFRHPSNGTVNLWIMH